MIQTYKDRAVQFFHTNETKLNIGFFLSGFVFDIFTLSQVDDTFSLVQQVIYLTVIGLILYFDTLQKSEKWNPKVKTEKIWQYRSLILHFSLGSLLSIYSLFFIKSASLFSSMIFILFILGILVINEMSFVQKGSLSVKASLFVLCLFSFFSLLVPTVLGFVGWTPFIISLALTIGVLSLILKKLQGQVQNKKILFKTLAGPGLGVLSLFTFFYLMGWVPPVPLSVKSIGIYHDVTFNDGQYVLKYERDFYKFWQNGAQSFLSRPQDKIVIFTQISSPSRFDDEVVYHWQLYSKKLGWMTQDRIPISIKGGRQKGFRGYGVKQNYTSGEWRVLVETTHGREIGRIYFDVEKTDQINELRQFKQDVF